VLLGPLVSSRINRQKTEVTCSNVVGTFISPAAVFRSEFADGFPNGSLLTVTYSRRVNGEFFRALLQTFQAHRVTCSYLLLLDIHASNKRSQAKEFCE